MSKFLASGGGTPPPVGKTLHLDYADIIYDKPFNDSFKEKLEKVQYSAALIITGAIKSTSWECLYKELGLEPVCDRRWYHKLVRNSKRSSTVIFTILFVS